MHKMHLSSEKARVTAHGPASDLSKGALQNKMFCNAPFLRLLPSCNRLVTGLFLFRSVEYVMMNPFDAADPP